MKYIFILLVAIGCGYQEWRETDCFNGCEESLKGDKGEPGTNGSRGSAGNNGVDGKNGNDGAVGPRGLDGAVGVQGEQGETGEIGPAGIDGKDAILQVIDPCGKQSQFDEVILVLSTGELVALYYDHANKRSALVLLITGNYVTTDGTNCYFTVTNEGEVSW